MYLFCFTLQTGFSFTVQEIFVMNKLASRNFLIFIILNFTVYNYIDKCFIDEKELYFADI